MRTEVGRLRGAHATPTLQFFYAAFCGPSVFDFYPMVTCSGSFTKYP